MADKGKGRVNRVAGPVVTAEGISPRMYDVVLVGELKLMGEVIKLVGDRTVIQVYEDTSGIRPGEAVVDTGAPLQVELGPGLLSSIYDGVQRPLPVLKDKQGDFVSRGVTAPGLDRSKKWMFKPTVKKGDELKGGMVVGEVPEGNVVHRVMLPPGVSGQGQEHLRGGVHASTSRSGSSRAGTGSADAEVAGEAREAVHGEAPPGHPAGHRAEGARHALPARQGRHGGHPGRVRHRQDGHIAAAVQVERRADRRLRRLRRARQRDDRGADDLPGAGGPEDRASRSWAGPCSSRTHPTCPSRPGRRRVYTGITIAEYYRDMGYDVSLMADSTSRWAEAMREISSRLEEMPGEEGYPAYLASRLSEFYERCGRVKTLCGPDRVHIRHRGRVAVRRRLQRARHAEHAQDRQGLLGARLEAQGEAGTSRRSTGSHPTAFTARCWRTGTGRTWPRTGTR